MDVKRVVCVACSMVFTIEGRPPIKCPGCQTAGHWHKPESVFPTESEGRKYDQEKPDWSLLPLSALDGAVRVLTFGAHKYDRDNWLKVPDGKNRYYAAAMRHLEAYQRGEEKDPESGLSHLDHAMCCLIFLKGLGA